MKAEAAGLRVGKIRKLKFALLSLAFQECKLQFAHATVAAFEG